MTHLEKCREALGGMADAMLVRGNENIFYLCGFSFSDGALLILADAAYLLTDGRYVEAARAAVSSDFTVLCPEGGATAMLPSLLARHTATSLLLEEDVVTLADYGKLQKALPTVQLVAGGDGLLKHLRLFKDEAELAAMEEAQRLTDAAFAHILDFIRPGLREIDVALELELFMRKNGSSGVAFDTIAVSGTASSLPHGVPRDIPLQRGFLTMDFGARVNGYCADMTRTVVLGGADDEMERLYHTVLAAQSAALSHAACGISCRALDAVARGVIEEAGYHGAFSHSLGHGVGLYIHEAPSLSPRAPETLLLERGMVVTVEPGIYLAGRYGCRIEDMIAVTHDGHIHNFTKSPKDMIVLSGVGE